MSDKAISELQTVSSAKSEDLILLSKLEDEQFMSYGITKGNLYTSADFLLANERFLSANVTLADINDNEISGYAQKTIATNNSAGLVKIGYVGSGKNYPVSLSNDQMFVHVPWTGGSASDVEVDNVTIKKDEDHAIYVYTDQIASRSFVNSSIQNVAAFYITKNEQGEQFRSYAELSSATVFYYAGEEQQPSRNDYCIVSEDETKTTALGVNPTTRYTFVSADDATNGHWEFQYVVNNTALTDSQISAINSTITKTKVDQMENIANIISNLELNGFQLSTITGEDEYGNPHTYQILLKEIR